MTRTLDEALRIHRDAEAQHDAAAAAATYTDDGFYENAAFGLRFKGRNMIELQYASSFAFIDGMTATFQWEQVSPARPLARRADRSRGLVRMASLDETARKDHPGVERHRLADATWLAVGNGTYLATVHETGPLAGTMFLRYDQGGYSPDHVHPGGEELFIIRGRLRVGEQLLEAGDHLYTPPGGVHDVEALTDVVALLTLPDGIEFVGD